MKTLQIDEKKARSLFKSATNEFKEMLTDTFGEAFFTGKITDRVKRFEDACGEVGEDPNDDKFHKGPKDEVAYRRIKVIVQALNEEWKADILNTSQYKYYPYFEIKSGVGLSFYDFVSWRTDTCCGPRFAFKSAELAKYAGTQFLQEYTNYLT